MLLVTSRETRRWVVPKGNPIKGLELHEAAAHEAYQEAGVAGIPCPTALGEYRYQKRRRNGTTRNVIVALFPLAVRTQADEWPEQDERESRWFDLPGAAAAVDEPDLKSLIAGFRAASVAPNLAERALPMVRTKAREKLPMLRWFHALMPQQGRFFDLFEAHALTLVAAPRRSRRCYRAARRWTATSPRSSAASTRPTTSRARCCTTSAGCSSPRSIAAPSPA